MPKFESKLRGQGTSVYVLGDYAYVADTYSGLQIIRLSYSLTNTSVLDSQTISATIPSGMEEGIYDVVVSNPDGQKGTLFGGFEVKQYHATITTDIHLSAGLNFFGYPLEPQTGYTSYDLIADLGTDNEVSRIQRYDPNTKIFETATYSNGTPCGSEFTIVNGEGYLVYMKMDKSVSLAGASITVNPAISCNKGLNVISIPSPPSGYNSYDLLSYLGSPDEITSIQRFNKVLGTFETTACCYGQPSGAKFNIVNGEAYLIHMKVAKDKDGP